MSELHLGAVVSVRIQSSADIVTARQEGRTMAATLGFTNTTLTIIATARRPTVITGYQQRCLRASVWRRVHNCIPNPDV